MDEQKKYTSNSNKSKLEGVTEQTPAKRAPIVNGAVKVREETAAQKIFSTFFAKDIADVKTHLIYDVLIPELKDTLYSLFNNGLQMWLYGGTRSKKTGPGSISVNYRGCYTGNQPGRPAQSNNQTDRRGMNFDNVEFERIQDAEGVLEQMVDILEQFGSVSVADFCEMANIQDEYTDRRYGWTNLATAEVRRMSGGGYYIKFPKAILLPK